MSLGGYNPAPLPYWQPVPPYAGPPKSRTVYVLLGIFLGMFGVHNFYAGHTNKGAIQLAITLATFFMGALISWIWAIVEVCLVDRDGHNVYMV